MATLTVQDITLTGLVPVLSAVSSSDKFLNSEKEFLMVTNGGASAITVTINATHKCSYNFAHNITVSVAAGATELIGLMPVKWFNDDADMVTINYSATTDVTAAVIRLG